MFSVLDSTLISRNSHECTRLENVEFVLCFKVPVFHQGQRSKSRYFSYQRRL